MRSSLSFSDHAVLRNDHLTNKNGGLHKEKLAQLCREKNKQTFTKRKFIQNVISWSIFHWDM